MREDFAELTGGPAAFRRQPERGLLVVTGGDRMRFLNGMVSNDVAKLAPGQTCYATQLDRKGHVLADLWLLVLDGAIWLDLADARAGVVAEMLEKHVIADDVVIEDRSAAWTCVDFEGPGARAALGAQAPALEADQVERESADSGERVWFGGAELTDQGVRLLAPTASADALAESCGLPELSDPHAEILRIARFRPRYGVDLDERSFPAEARLERALSFSKGCYIGQEIVARIESRGAVNKLLVSLAAEGQIAPGAAIQADGREVGKVTSAAVWPGRGAIALGYVKKAHAAPGTRVAIDGVPAEVTGPPLDP